MPNISGSTRRGEPAAPAWKASGRFGRIWIGSMPDIRLSARGG
jgi:hypothetical protein